MRTVSIMLLAAAGLTSPEAQATEPPSAPVAEQLAAAETTAEDLKLVDEAFSRLAAGDESMAIDLLSPKVSWRAVAARDMKAPAQLGAKGAALYLKTMAAAIRSGKYKLDLLRIEPMSGGSWSPRNGPRPTVSARIRTPRSRSRTA